MPSQDDDDDSGRSRIDNLLSKYPIHEVFKPPNFDNSIQYDEIRPVLRLASKLLLMKKTLPQWYMLLNGDTAEKRTSDGRAYFQLGRPASSTDVESIVSSLLRLGLSKMVSFSAKKMNKPGIRAWTGCIRHLRNPVFPNGCRSRIEISADFLEEVYATISAASDRDNVSLIPLLDLAQTLVHELAHAAMGCSEGSLCGEQPHYVMEGCTTAEEGFELEMLQVGGVLETLHAQWFEGLEKVDRNCKVLVVNEWPTCWYGDREAEEEFHDAFMLDPTSKTGRVHILKADLGSNMFEDWFWEGENPPAENLPDSLGPFIADDKALHGIREHASFHVDKKRIVHQVVIERLDRNIRKLYVA